jgi:uncharacterized membrane-anchored protein YjiN (DUF445 family)
MSRPDQKPKVVKKRDPKRYAVPLLEALLEDPEMIERAEKIIRRKKARDMGAKM